MLEFCIFKKIGQSQDHDDSYQQNEDKNIENQSCKPADLFLVIRKEVKYKRTDGAGRNDHPCWVLDKNIVGPYQLEKDSIDVQDPKNSDNNVEWENNTESFFFEQPKEEKCQWENQWDGKHNHEEKGISNSLPFELV